MVKFPQVLGPIAWEAPAETFEFDGAELREAVERCFERRGVKLYPRPSPQPSTRMRTYRTAGSPMVRTDNY